MEISIPGKEIIRYEIPDEWWLTSGMNLFNPQSEHYEPSDKFPIQQILIVDHLMIYPRKRNEGVPDFRRESIINLLSRIKNHRPIDPIEIMEPSWDNGYEYWLKDGFHRYRVSFAVGFKKIPAILVFNPDIE
jgi:hypothetical protein